MRLQSLIQKLDHNLVPEKHEALKSACVPQEQDQQAAGSQAESAALPSISLQVHDPFMENETLV